MRELLANAAIVLLSLGYGALSLILGWENVRNWFRTWKRSRAQQ